MNSNCSIVSGSGHAVGIMDVIPAHKFPDIWENIFMHLSRLDDLRNVSQTSQEWSEILQSSHKRSTRMLQSIPKVFTFLSRYLRKDDVLQLRKVCGAWSQGVDEFLEEAGRPTPYKEEERERNASSVRISPTRNPIFTYRNHLPYIVGDIQGSLDVDAFLESMGEHPRNPFIGRQLAIYRFRLNSSIADVQDGINKLFPRLGYHLTYLVMHVEGDLLTLNQFVGMVQTVINNTPNLKQLALSVPPNLAEDANIPNITVPVLTQLRTLKLRSDSPREGVPVQALNLLQTLIQNHAPQLERFDVGGVHDAYWSTLNWPNLTELRVEFDVEYGVTFSSLFNMAAPQLSRLFIRLEGTYYLSELGELLEHFPSLKVNNVVIRAPHVIY